MERRQLSHELIGTQHLRLGFLASHNGSAMQEIVGTIQEGRLNATPQLIISNNSKSGALMVARELEISWRHISSFTNPNNMDEVMYQELQKHNVELVICSGWMKEVGPKTIAAFKNRIINIHPAVHKEYMGDGWMDMAVHEAVIRDKKTTSGYTIHLLNEEKDKGEVLATGFVRVRLMDPADTPVSLQKKIKHAESDGLVTCLQDISKGEILLPKAE